MTPVHSCAGSGELGVCTVGAAVAAAADVEAPPLFPAPFPALGALVGTVVGPAVGAALAMTAGLAADGAVVESVGCVVIRVGVLVNDSEGPEEVDGIEGARDEYCGNRTTVASNPDLCSDSSEVKFTTIPVPTSTSCAKVPLKAPYSAPE